MDLTSFSLESKQLQAVGRSTQVSTLCETSTTRLYTFHTSPQFQHLFSEGTGANNLVYSCNGLVFKTQCTVVKNRCLLLNSLVNKSCLSSLIASDRTLALFVSRPRLHNSLVWVIPGRPKSFLGTLLSDHLQFVLAVQTLSTNNCS